MKIIPLKSKIIFFSLIQALVLLSCTTWSEKEWKNLENRKFYFQRFYYYNKSANSEEALHLMKEVPVKKILTLLERYYDITIDTSGFDGFMIYPDLSKISGKGIMSKSDFIWEDTDIKGNMVKFEYNVLFNPTNHEYRLNYKLTMNVNDKERRVFTGEFFKISDILDRVAWSLGLDKDKGNNNIYFSKAKGLKIDLSGVQSVPTLDPSKRNTVLSEMKIKDDIKKFINELPAGERERFKRELMKFLLDVQN